jgi:hypothetical protein
MTPPTIYSRDHDSLTTTPRPSPPLPSPPPFFPRAADAALLPAFIAISQPPPAIPQRPCSLYSLGARRTP